MKGITILQGHAKYGNDSPWKWYVTIHVQNYRKTENYWKHAKSRKMKQNLAKCRTWVKRTLSEGRQMPTEGSSHFLCGEEHKCVREQEETRYFTSQGISQTNENSEDKGTRFEVLAWQCWLMLQASGDCSKCWRCWITVRWWRSDVSSALGLMVNYIRED